MLWLHKTGILPGFIRVFILFIIISLLTPLVSMLVYMFPRTIESGQAPDKLGLPYEEVVFTTSSDIELKGWFIPSDRGEAGAPTIIFLHGYPAEKGDLITFAYPYHDAYNIFLFDFRALGESGGIASTLGYKEAEDVLSAVQYLESRGHTNIGLWGFSMGAAAALMSLDDSDNIQAIVADSSYAHLRDMSRIIFENLTPGGGLLGDIQMMWAETIFWIDVDTISPAQALASTHKPVLLSYLPGDIVIPISQAEKLNEAGEGRDNVSVWVHDTGTHGLMSVKYQKFVRGFFDTHLMKEIYAEEF